MPRGENEAFKEQQGRFARNREDARNAGEKGRVSRDMWYMKNLLIEKNGELIEKPNGTTQTRGEGLMNTLFYEMGRGNMKAYKIWLEIMKFGEPNVFEITGKDGEPLIPRSIEEAKKIIDEE